MRQEKIRTGKKKFLRGFTLMELLIYIAIFAITAGLLTGILYTTNRTQTREQIASAVNQELNFVMQTVQRLVRESSQVETPAGESSNLTLRFKNLSLDPTIICRGSAVGCFGTDPNKIYVQQGTGAATELTSDQVKIAATCGATSTDP